MSSPSRLSRSLLGITACLLTAGGGVFAILEAVSLSMRPRQISFAGLAIAASVLSVISLGCVVTFSVQYAWRREGVRKRSAVTGRILPGVCVTLSVIALIVSLASVVTIKTSSSEVVTAALLGTNDKSDDQWDKIIAAHFAIWTLACLSQAGLFSMPLWSRPSEPKLRAIPYTPPRDSVMSESRKSEQTTNIYMLEPAQPSSPLAQAPSYAMRSSQSIKSLRESLHQVVRPVTSRSRLIARPSLSRDSSHSLYSDTNSVENVPPPDGFDSWDTSSVSPQVKDAVLLSAPSRGTALEPIPGSRPASPARPLDGPFPQSDLPAELPLSPPPKILPDTSRPPSPAISEADVHPLFRSESPLPPPEVTPGTNVMASPLANKAITYPAGPYNRMRSNSRVASPLLPQGRTSRAGTAGSQQSSRSPSPPSREMTPPIPNFVLNSTPRSDAGSPTSCRRPRVQSETVG